MHIACLRPAQLGDAGESRKDCANIRTQQRPETALKSQRRLMIVNSAATGWLKHRVVS